MNARSGEFLNLECFRSLSPETVGLTETVSRIHTLDRGMMLFNVGDPADSIYVVLEGGIKIVEDTFSGKRISLELNARGDIFGLSALTDPRPYPHSAYAVDASRVAAIYRDDANKLVESHVDFAHFVIGQLTARVQRAHARLKQIVTEPVDRRLGRTLLYYASKFGHEIENTVALSIFITQQEMADFTGSTLESVNRVLRSWEREGWIRCSRQHLEIINLNALESYVSH